MNQRAACRVSKVRCKSDLPVKTCLGCGRPFTWRKKWARDWDSVRYCSQRCRRTKARKAGGERAGDCP